MTIVYIHGATATGASFNYIRNHVACPDILLEYDSEAGFFHNLKQMYVTLHDTDDDLFFIGHSLGGIYCLCLAEHFKQRTKGGLTISTPYGGSEIASFAKFFAPFSTLLKEITPVSAPIEHAKNIKITCPWTNIVTTRGSSPWIPGANDGVVTIESQRRKNTELLDLHTNHYEVLIHPETIKHILDRLPKTKK